MTKSIDNSKVSATLNILDRHVIIADSDEDYEVKRRQLLSQISKETEVTESKLQVGILVLTEITPTS